MRITGKAGYSAPGDLTPYPRNSNTHTIEQIERIKKSIIEFGFTRPVLVDETSMILAGHGAVIAATELDLKRIPIRTISGLTEDQKRAYVIVDNRTAELSTWDKDMLALSLDELAALDFDMELIGFDPIAGDPARGSRSVDEDVRVRCPKCGHEW